MTTKTTVYLLNDETLDSIEFLISCIAEYASNHLDQLDICKRISAQLIHCKDNFTEEYK